MREIKFRGKRNNDGIWVQGYYVESPYGDIYIIDKRNRHHDVIPATVGQYTELQDMNDREVYEGDILQSVNNVTKDKCEVVFRGGGFYKRDIKAFYDEPYFDRLFRAEMGMWKIIGNVHENPELLNTD